MVGSPKLRVTALTSDGRNVPVMQDGKWV
ncbi:aminopeptidase [Deinococcus sp. AJ005]|nr:aminopeptidase [Deinococcus sp. AJ005]